jgi:hypothetical protein
MWSLLRNVSTVEAFQQAGAWQSTYEAAQSLARRLQWYRDGLAGKWSPDSSEAAALYLGRLDELIGSAQQLADVSVANRQALVTLANAVDEARPKLQRVYEESQALRQIETQPSAVAPVASRQQQLHKQAIEIMESLGGAAMDSWRHYATADDYQPPQPTPAADTYTPENGPLKGHMTERREMHEASTSSVAGKTSEDEPISLASLPDEQFGDPTGRVAAGKGTSQLVAPASARSIDALGIPAASGAIDEINGQGIGASTGVTMYEPSASLRPVDELGVIRGQVQRSSSNGSVTRSSPATADRPLSGNRSNVPRERAVNRVGGVVGERDPGMGLMGAGGVSPGKGSRELRRHREYDVVDGWKVAKGVPAIIEPSSEPTYFDPGPGVLGSGR